MKKLLITCLGVSVCLALYLGAGRIVSVSGDDPTSVVSCLGDSITEGVPYSGTENTYPARLQAMLDATYGSGSFQVINHGVAGYRADQVLADLQNLNWMGQDNPDYVLLLVGGNDLAQLQSIESTVAEVQAIVDLVTAHTNPDGSRPQIIVSAIPPNLISELASWWVSVYNDSLESDLTGMDLWITSNWDDFYDPATGMAKASLMADPVHPNVQGYIVMAENWFEALDSLLPTPTPTTTSTATATWTPTPTATSTATPTHTPTPTSTPTPTTTSTATPTYTPTTTPTPTATPTTTPSGPGITDPDLVVTPAPLPLQPVGTPFVDPVFGTTLRRVSNTSESGGFETHIYSQLQAFSSDNAYLLLDGSDGFIVRRVSDLSLVTGLDTSEWNAPRWHPTQPHTLVHFDTNADTTVRLQFTDLDTLTTTTVYTFPAQYERIRVNQSFDELSEDGRWLAGMVTRDDGADVIFALDIQALALGALLPLPDLYAGPCTPDPVWGEVEPDWVGVSPLGNYLVVQWARDGITRCSGLETFDPQSGAFVGRVYDGHQHGDLGVDSDGITEFFMTFEMAAPPPDNDRPAIGVRALPGTSTASPPTYVQVLDWADDGHISCRGPNGVCLVTYGGWEGDGWMPFERELFLQYTDGSVLRLVHHRSSSCGYWVQPRASISRDGRYVVFASDWGQETGTDSCGGGNEMGRGDPYIIDLSASCDLAGDLDCDCDVDIADIMLVAACWHAAVDDPDFNPNYDLDDDGNIDIVDIMLVAVHWGESCEG